jgi:hypothetical protein
MTTDTQPLGAYRDALADLIARDEAARRQQGHGSEGHSCDWDERATAAGWPPDEEVPV